jgi:methylmalonyl-CoA mutase
VDASLYVMTPEYGAASQLEKIDMLDFADFVAINKFDRKGAADALRDVSKQVQRNKGAFKQSPEEMPVFGTQAARFNDDGVTALYQAILPRLQALGLKTAESRLPRGATRHSTNQTPIVPPQRVRYLAEIADTVRGYKRHALEQARVARERQALLTTQKLLALTPGPSPASAGEGGARSAPGEGALAQLDGLISARDSQLAPRSQKLLAMWPQMQEAYAGDEYVVKIRDREIRTALTHTSLSGTKIRKVALPRYEDHGELLKWLLL